MDCVKRAKKCHVQTNFSAQVEPVFRTEGVGVGIPPGLHDLHPFKKILQIIWY